MSREANLNKLYGFLESDKKSLLVTGWDDKEKLKIVLASLNQCYQQGIIYCNFLGGIGELINNGLSKNFLPKTVNSRKTYEIGKMRIRFKKYSENNRAVGNNQQGFSLYYPVGAILQPKTEQQLINKIKTDTAEKIIILTHNDHTINVDNEGVNDFELLNIVDETFNLDNSKNNPELYETVRKNLADESFNYRKN